MDRIAENADQSRGVTADDVAAAAGVSRWTVARAFKKRGAISPKTRQKVLAAAERLGYAPDLLAASLASDRSHLVALITNDFNNPHKLVLLERLTRILWSQGWGTLLVNMSESEDASAALLAASQRRVDAAVMIGTRFDDRVLDTALGARRVKKLVVFARYSNNPNTLTISCDDRLAMREIGDHLFARGYASPAFIAGPDTQSAKLHRVDSFRDHWLGLTGGAVPTRHAAGYDFHSAIDTVNAVLDAALPGTLPDVLVCENDILAIGAKEALRARGGAAAGIAVTGFDDIPLAAAPSYHLTTYRQPITAMCERLLDVLSGRLNEDVFVPGTLIVRGG
ncbi:DNA-binding transcriptional regulator, LacI/PurR family [Paracoccus isoporae]|uniref:DNA-binding transcriptional regulator, LacI/PurR family n=1 Tax=Paracoccus isoporae TaxID=591205 RepID=A0A1G6WMV7_9RHOB|nr:LacI family DNA-binding transcriptional regulator [Paracoccus isoporae]SDD67119.1 DNA-binding transcriptional regulator, LacI/PurR family [Paracoccus isoporae]